MICENGNFIRDLEEIVSEAHLISNEFQNEIRQAKYQIWNLVRQQIKNIKNRKVIDNFLKNICSLQFLIIEKSKKKVFFSFTETRLCSCKKLRSM